MRVGDGVLFYTQAAHTGIAGVAKVVSRAIQIGRNSIKKPYFDAATKPEQPRWLQLMCKRYANTFTFFGRITQYSELADMKLLARGNRLSNYRVTAGEWNYSVLIKMRRGHIAGKRLEK